MRSVIVPKSDQINADDLLAGPRTVTITRVAITPGSEQPVSMFFEGDGGKPYRPCKSMCRLLVHAWGPDAAAYAGRGMTLYRDPKVRWGGLDVGGIRLRHLSHLDREMVMALTVTKGSRKPYTVKPLAAPDGKPSAAEQRMIDGVQALVARIKGAEKREDVPAILAEPDTAKRREWLKTNRPQLSAALESAIAAVGAENTEGAAADTEASTGDTTTATENTEAETSNTTQPTDNSPADPRLAGLSPAGAAFLKEFLDLQDTGDVIAQEQNAALKAQARKLPKQDQPRIATAIEAHKQALRDKA